jgi:hypothetical protein
MTDSARVSVAEARVGASFTPRESGGACCLEQAPAIEIAPRVGPRGTRRRSGRRADRLQSVALDRVRAEDARLVGPCEGRDPFE